MIAQPFGFCGTNNCPKAFWPSEAGNSTSSGLTRSFPGKEAGARGRPASYVEPVASKRDGGPLALLAARDCSGGGAIEGNARNMAPPEVAYVCGIEDPRAVRRNRGRLDLDR